MLFASTRDANFWQLVAQVDFGCTPRTTSSDLTSYGRCTNWASLREIGELIDLRTRKIAACESVRALLKHEVANVRAKLHELQKLESELITDLQKCDKELKR